jgi:anti-sigma B factor antagonist
VRPPRHNPVLLSIVDFKWQEFCTQKSGIYPTRAQTIAEISVVSPGASDRCAKDLTGPAEALRIAPFMVMAIRETVMAAIQPRISVEYKDEATIVAFTDEKILEETDVRDLREAVESVVEQAPGIHLILDFRHVKFLSSAVLGLLIRISKRVYEQEGELRLCNIHPGIHEVFKITRLTNVFEIYEDVDSATRSFSEHR